MIRLTRFQQGITGVTMIVLAAEIFWPRLSSGWGWYWITHRDFARALSAVVWGNYDTSGLASKMFGTVLLAGAILLLEPLLRRR